MKTRTINIYSFNELSQEAQEKAIEYFSDINVSHEWWEFIYEDANNIGLKITGFDLDRGAYCKGEFILDLNQVISSILKEHGKKCETYKTAKRYQEELNKINIEENQDKWEELEDNFLYDLLEDYRVMLQQEYDYMTSRESIIETIQINDYEFLENGKLA